MDKAYVNIFFHLFEINLLSKKKGSGIVSIYRFKNKIFHVYADSWKGFKEHYFIVFPLTILTHN